MAPSENNSGAAFGVIVTGRIAAMKKFPDFVPPTKVSYLVNQGPTLHLRKCILQVADDPSQEWTFDKEEIRIGSMEDNDIVLADDTVSRYHSRPSRRPRPYRR